MKRTFITALLVLVLLALVSPTLAQDTAPESAGTLSRQEVILIGSLFVALALFGIFSAVLASLASKLFNALPPWAADLLKSNIESLITIIERQAQETPNTIDDDLVKRIADEWRELTGKAPIDPSGDVN